MDYLRRAGDLSGYQDLSYEMDDQVITDCREALNWAEDTGRNDLGRVLAIMRVLKKYDKLKV
jgi:hypothetical protein